MHPDRPKFRCRGTEADIINHFNFYRMKEIQTKRTPRFRRWCRKGYAAFASLRRQVTIGVLSVSMSTILLSTTTPVQAQTVDSLTIARELEIETVEVTGVKATPTRSAMSSTSVSIERRVLRRRSRPSSLCCV